MNESELQNNGWISLYMELALVSHVRDLTDVSFSFIFFNINDMINTNIMNMWLK